MGLKERTVARINEVFAEQGNLARINHKNGKTYVLTAQNNGSYRIDDKTSVWSEQTFMKIVPTVEALAEVILGL